MNEQQIENAYKWNDKHQNHVVEMMRGTDGIYSPNEEDFGSPQNWKPQHWRWFFTHGA